ncbi:MAG: transketolase [Holosporales bacterium]|jgi:transketolase
MLNPVPTDFSNAIRFLAAEGVEAARSGHPGMPMGCAEIAAVLFAQTAKICASQPLWPDRDRVVLSAGHGSMLLYSVAYLLGYKEMPLAQLKNFRQWGSITPGHPERHLEIGVETTTGPLGQGFANAVGMAIAERRLNAEFGDSLVDHRTYVLAGDGCLMEGISYEAAALAGHLKLGRLTVLWDDNGISIDGKVSLATSENQIERFAAAGWRTCTVNGHDMAALMEALAWAQQSSEQPSFIACRTVIGFGAPKKAGTAGIHGSPLGAEELAAAKAALHWPYPAFEVPAATLAAWREAGHRHETTFAAWQQRFEATPADTQAAFTRRLAGELPEAALQALANIKAQFLINKPNIASRQASGDVLEAVVSHLPEILGGSADLSGSNNTKAKAASIFSASNYGGKYLHYGIREHAMAAIMNGIAVHGGLIPFGGTFLVFADYLKPALRLSALMHQRVIYVLTHDSIGVGEDGPTHQPIEHLAMLRSVPGLRVFRPADAVETAECWALALSDIRHPSVLALTRQALPTLRGDTDVQNRSALGGYLLREATNAKVTLMATGSEVALAVDAQKLLAQDGIAANVISMPSRELFLEQPAAYRANMLPATRPVVIIEAASTFGWGDLMRGPMATVTMQGFGGSAPGDVLFREFGFTPAAVVAKVRELL